MSSERRKREEEEEATSSDASSTSTISSPTSKSVRSPTDKLDEAFQKYDTNKDGFLSKDEFREVSVNNDAWIWMLQITLPVLPVLHNTSSFFNPSVLCAKAIILRKSLFQMMKGANAEDDKPNNRDGQVPL